eukprot:14134715-Heterocapsa_arctica.AAC.1
MTSVGEELARHAHDFMVSNMKVLRHLLRYVHHTCDDDVDFCKMRDTVGEILEVRRNAGWRGDEHRISRSMDAGEARLIQSWLAEFNVKLV